MKFFKAFFISAVLLGLGFSAARAWDPNKPFIYEMRIAFEADNWFNAYSTATILSKSDNSVAFCVVANSTTTPTYQLVVTTQGNVGIGTASPSASLDVNGTAKAASFSGSGASLTGITAAQVGAIADSSWTDYSGTSTIVGWSSFNTYGKAVFYKKVGSLVFVYFYLGGASNSTTASFTLPYSAYADTIMHYWHTQSVGIMDNGTWQSNPGLIQLIDSNKAEIYRDWYGTAFTASGGKVAAGQFWYQAAD